LFFVQKIQKIKQEKKYGLYKIIATLHVFWERITCFYVEKTYFSELQKIKFEPLNLTNYTNLL